jgi:hypothetical protein
VIRAQYLKTHAPLQHIPHILPGRAALLRRTFSIGDEANESTELWELSQLSYTRLVASKRSVDGSAILSMIAEKISRAGA